MHLPSSRMAVAARMGGAALLSGCASGAHLAPGRGRGRSAVSRSWQERGSLALFARKRGARSVPLSVPRALPHLGYRHEACGQTQAHDKVTDAASRYFWFEAEAEPEPASLNTGPSTQGEATSGGVRALLRAALDDPSVRLVVVEGPAGTGKTMAACAAAARFLQISRSDRKVKNKKDRGASGRASTDEGAREAAENSVLVVRPTVAVAGEQIGFLPGGMQEKMDPWVQPVVEHMRRSIGEQAVAEAMARGLVQTLPLAHIRGRDLQNTFVVADEMQNSTPAQMLALLTRLGDGSRIVVTGDQSQTDVGAANGLSDLVRRLEGGVGFHGGGSDTLAASLASSVRVVRFGPEDIMRGGFVRDIIAMYGAK